MQRKLKDKVFVMETIRDLDEAIDQICEAMTPDEKLDPFAEDLCPYFGILWSAAEALSLYLNDHPELIKNRTVLELGCGTGYPSLVATHLGGDVLATDFHPSVEEYFFRNAQHSNIICKYQRLNWRDPVMGVGQFDVVMGSDILYESKHPKEVALGLIRFMKPNGIILLSDPGRAYLQAFLGAMKELGFHEEYEIYSAAEKDNFIFKFKKF